MIELFLIILILISALSFLLVSYYALKNDPNYIVNRLFAVAFALLCLFSLSMGAESLAQIITSPFLTTDTIRFIVIFGLSCIIASFALLLSSALIIESGLPSLNRSQLLKVIIPAVILISDSFVMINFQEYYIITITIFFIGLFYYGFNISRIFNKAAEDAPEIKKRKINLWVRGFFFFGLFSFVAWVIPVPTILESINIPFDVAIFVAYFIQALASFIGALLMLYSFKIK